MPMLRSRPLLRLTLLAAALAAAGAAQAQSLGELYEAARAYDATYLSAKAAADSAQYRVAQADALARPSAALAASLTQATSDRPKPLGSADGTTAAATVSGRFPLFNRANEATISQAARQLEQSRIALEAAEQDLIVGVAQAYFDVLAAQDTLASARANKAGITEQLASAKRNFEVGTATITDTREAQAKFDLAVAQEIAAENDLRTKRIALDQRVGRSGVAPKPLAAPVTLPPVTPDDAEQWVGNADNVHPAIRKARLDQEIAKLEVDKARAARLPTVDAVGSFGSSYARGNLPTLAGTTTTGTIGLQLNMTLYSGGQIDNRVNETVVLEEKSRIDLEAARRAVAQATRQAFFGVQSGLARVKALEAAESSSKLALEATQLGYRVGVRVNLDVLNAQTQLFSTQADLAKARYDVITGSLKLRQAAGQLTAADLQAANGLIAK